MNVPEGTVNRSERMLTINHHLSFEFRVQGTRTGKAADRCITMKAYIATPMCRIVYANMVIQQ